MARTEIIRTREVKSWLASLQPAQRARVQAVIDVLAERGPTLGRPHVDHVKMSRHANMKELRTGTLRVLFAFDRQQRAVLLLGGDKRATGNRWYARNVPRADRLMDQHRGDSGGGPCRPTDRTPQR